MTGFGVVVEVVVVEVVVVLSVVVVLVVDDEGDLLNEYEK